MKKNYIIIVLILVFIFLDHAFSQLLIPFRKGDKWGYSNQKKEVIVEPIFDMTYPLQEGMGLVVIDKMYGFVDSTGKLITDVKKSSSVIMEEISFAPASAEEILSSVSGRSPSLINPALMAVLAPMAAKNFSDVPVKFSHESLIF